MKDRNPIQVRRAAGEPQHGPRAGADPSGFVRGVLPLLASLVMHAVAAILIVSAAGVAVRTADPGQTEQVQTDDARTQLYEAAAGGAPNAGLHDSPFRAAAQERPVDAVRSSAVAERFTPTLDLDGVFGGPPSGAPLPPLVNLGSCQQWVSLRTGPGQGGPDATGDGDAGPPAAFGIPGGGAADARIKPRASGPLFCCCGGNARQIVFLCDVSASMLNRTASLKYELGRAVEGLKPIQTFNIIFFQGGSCLALDLNGLLPATPDNKKRAHSLLERVTAGGVTDPLPALDLAFRQHPSILYLLSDGDFPDGAAVVERIHLLNKDRRVRVNAIVFVARRRDGEPGLGFLADRIAGEGGGKFQVVSEEE